MLGMENMEKENKRRRGEIDWRPDIFSAVPLYGTKPAIDHFYNQFMSCFFILWYVRLPFPPQRSINE